MPSSLEGPPGDAAGPGAIEEPEPAVFQAVEIEAFRGFRDPQRIRMGASAVVVSGMNGTGKTSFFDALQWLLIGELPRLTLHADRKSFDVVVNRWSSGPAVVTAEMALQGSPVRVRRTGNQEGSILEWHGPDGVVRGADAETRLSLALLGRTRASMSEVLLNSALLQQEAVRSLLEANPQARFKHLAALMGLDDLSRFTDAAKRRSDALSKRASEVRTAAQRVTGDLIALEARESQLKNDLVSEATVNASRRALAAAAAAVSKTLVLPSGAPEQPQTASNLARALSTLEALCTKLVRQDDSLRGREAELPEPPSVIEDSELSNLRSALEEARAARAAAEGALEAERSRRGALVELASRAIPLLGPSCPVCGLEIDPVHVEQHLREVVDDDDGALSDLEAEAQRAEERLTGAQNNVRLAEQRLAQAANTRALVENVREERDLWTRDVASLRESTGDLVLLGDDVFKTSNEREGLEAVLVAIERLRRPAEAHSRSLAGSTVGQTLDRISAELHSMRQRLAEAEQLASTQSQRSEGAKLLTAASARAAASVTEKRLQQVQPLVDDIFARLDPHPAFTRLEVRLGDYYRKGVAEAVTLDETEGVEADPLLVFSSSQANVAALTWFLALSWSAGSAALPFLLLDDPLQSLDDVNVLGFADLCRRLRARRQLVVSTHEPRLSRLLERKLSPRVEGPSTLRLHFRAWDRSGPVVEASEVPDQSSEGRLHVLST
jgi:DNA repair exonuclease SbcCD ATPase subunit